MRHTVNADGKKFRVCMWRHSYKTENGFVLISKYKYASGLVTLITEFENGILTRYEYI